MLFVVCVPVVASVLSVVVDRGLSMCHVLSVPSIVVGIGEIEEQLEECTERYNDIYGPDGHTFYRDHRVRRNEIHHTPSVVVLSL